ncbi:MAG: holo-ACP synthase [Chloroflexota bacterium]
MLYSGVDIIEVARIERAVQRWGDRFLNRIYTPAEIRAYARRTTSLAARWAAKEATGKLLGVGLRGLGGADSGSLPWTDIEVLADKSGRPSLTLRGAALARAQELGLRELSVSLSHTDQHAIALVVALAAP